MRTDHPHPGRVLLEPRAASSLPLEKRLDVPGCITRSSAAPSYRNLARRMSLVEAASVRCNRTAHGRADEESSSPPTLVVPRRGMFRYFYRTKAVVADANTALLSHRGSRIA